jgi:opacity protein-like surface antigen
MKQNEFFLIIFLILCFLAIGPTQALAEGFIDIYGGGAMSETADVETSISSSGLGFVTTNTHSQRVDFDSSFTVGGRVGYWFDVFPYVGFSLDLSYFRAEGKNADIQVIPLSLLLMLRYPLFKSEKFRNGRIQPYAAIGPGLFYSHAKADFRPDLTEKISGDSYKIGLDVRAGLAWQFHKHLALFGEYRYTDFSIDLKQSDILYGLAGTKETMKTQLATNHFLIGLSYRF